MLALTHTHVPMPDIRSDRRLTALRRTPSSSGFTLSESMMAIAILSMVMAGAAGTFSIGVRSWRTTVATTDASNQASTTLSRIAHGIAGDCGLRAAFSPVTSTSDQNGWTITYEVPKGSAGTDTQINRLRYQRQTETIEFESETAPEVWTTIGKHVKASAISVSSAGVTVMVRSHSVAGNCSSTREMSSAIAFRNGS
jgi:prepilin-type N-terminal cleavage/methylation domain-containing protein